MKKHITAKRLVSLIGGLLLTALTAGCSTNQSETPQPSRAGKQFNLKIIPGPEYHFTSWWFIFPLQIYPQIACWLESPDGRYIDTIWATAKVAQGTWAAAPREGRPQALPVWSHLVAGQATALDALASATPTEASFQSRAVGASVADGDYLVKMEINRSYDYNGRYTKDNSGVNGQPSLVYACRIQVGSSGTEGKLLALGTGSVDGSDGQVRASLEGIDSALRLIESATIQYRPE